MKDGDLLIKRIREQAFGSVGDMDRKLLALAQDKTCSQAGLDSFIKTWDIERAPIRSIVLLAHIMKDHPSLVFPDEVTPRLNGVLSYCRFKEIQTRANLLNAEKSLKEKGVPYVLAGDMAMRGYFPDYQRWIAGLDILVPASEHDTALAALSSMVNDKQVNIHKAWDNGVISRANGQLPCPEDLVFMALVSVYETIIRKGSLNNNPSLVLDINSLAGLSGGLDHGLIWDNACLSGTEFQILFAEAVVGSVSRGVFAEEWPESSLSEKQLEKHFVDFLFKRDVIYGTEEHASSSRRLWISALTAGSNFGIVPSVMKKYLWNRYTLRHK